MMADTANDLTIHGTLFWNSQFFKAKVKITGSQRIMQDGFVINGIETETGLQVGCFVEFEKKSLGNWIFKAGQSIPDAYLEANLIEKPPVDKQPAGDIFTVKTVIEALDIGDDIRSFTEDHTRSTNCIATMLAAGYQVVGVQIFKQLETFGSRTLEATVRYTTLALYPSKPQASDAVLPTTTEESNNG